MLADRAIIVLTFFAAIEIRVTKSEHHLPDLRAPASKVERQIRCPFTIRRRRRRIDAQRDELCEVTNSCWFKRRRFDRSEGVCASERSPGASGYWHRSSI